MPQPIPLVTDIQGAGEPILCLHGHPGSSQCMQVFTESLSQRFRTVTPDLRGYGCSQVTESFDMDAHLVDLEALLDDQGITSCLVLGWSLGGILALELALRQPQRVRGLILVASAARPRSNHPPTTWIDVAYTGLASVLNRLWPGWRWNIETFGKRSLYRYLLQQHTSYAYRRLAAEAFPAYLHTSKQAQTALSRALKQGYNRLADLGDLTLPVLVLAGRADRHITPESSLETAGQLPHCQTHIYEEVAHLFPWEIPTVVLNDIYTWLRQQDSMGRL